jgi:hypothetical protein
MPDPATPADPRRAAARAGAPATAVNAGQDVPGSATAAAQATAGAPVSRATTPTTGVEPAFGWSTYAERVNGRFAMLGFAAVLLIEALSRDTFLHWAGLVP